MRVTLIQPHVHAGTRYDAGASLDLPEIDARWLLAKGIGRPELDPVRSEPAVVRQAHHERAEGPEPAVRPELVEGPRKAPARKVKTTAEENEK